MEPVGQAPEGGQIPNPADAFFKECLSNIPAARGFLREHFPPGMAAEARWMLLKREPESYLEKAKSQFMMLAENLREGGREEGREEGLQKGVIVGQILNCQEIPGLSPNPKESLVDESLENLQTMLHQLKSQVAKLLKH